MKTVRTDFYTGDLPSAMAYGYNSRRRYRETDRYSACSGDPGQCQLQPPHSRKSEDTLNVA